MAFIHGKEAVIKIDNDSGVLTDWSSFAKSVSWSREIDLADTNVLGLDSKQRIAGLKDASFSVEGPFDPTSYAHLDNAWGQSLTFELYPNGNSSGNPKITGECYMASMECSFDVDDAAGISMEFQVTGEVTISTVA